MKRFHISTQLVAAWIFILVALVLAGCAPSASFQSPALADVFTNNLNPNLIEICGTPISNTFEYQGVTYQYTLNCAFSYDPNRPQTVRIEPVGAPFEVNIPPQQIDPKPGETMINGYIIWSEVESFLTENRLQNYGELQLLGSPKTPLVYNQDKQRLEQYFDNMGFYRYENDPVGMVHLIPYGVMYCGKECIFEDSQVLDTQDLNGIPIGNPLQIVGQNEAVPNDEFNIFTIVEKRFVYIGAALASGSKLADGTLAKPYTNMWMCVYTSDPKRVKPCPLAEWAGIAKSDPHRDTGEDHTVFWEVENGLGYNVPEIVNTFVSINGTRDISGNPRFEPRPLAGTDKAWMCFESYCVVYNRTTLDPASVSFYPLGSYYYSEGFKNQTSQPEPTPVPVQNPTSPNPDNPIITAGQPIRTEVWDRFPFLDLGQQQVIGIVLHQGERALIGVKLRLMVTLPGDVKQTWEMASTDDTGRSIFAMPVIQAPNGSRIIYEVCTYGMQPTDICDQDSFTIQRSP